MKTSNLFLILVITILASCAKEVDEPIIEDPEVIVPVIKNVEAELFIKVTSRGKSVESNCTINGDVYFSDENGLIWIENVLMDLAGQQITIKSEGYFDEIKYIIPTLNERHSLEVQMREKYMNSDFQSDMGHVVNVFRGDYSIFPDAIIREDGSIYNGKVNVLVNQKGQGLYYTESRGYPHNLFIENESSSSLKVATYLDVIFEDDMGERLFLKEGSPVGVDLEFDLVNLGPVADQLDVYHYNEMTNRWEKSEQKLIRTGDRWTGELMKFGRVMFAETLESTIAEIELVDDTGNILDGMFTMIFESGTNPIYIGNTDDQGKIKAHIPVGKEFYVSIIPLCIPDDIQTSQSYNAVVSSSENVIQLEKTIIDEVGLRSCQGQLVGCNGQPLTNSMMRIDDGSTFDRWVFTDENGSFNVQVIDCFERIKFRGYDADIQVMGMEIVVELNDEGDIDLGTVSVCQ